MKIDKDLINACIDGDRKSQSKLYELSFSSLMNISYRYQKNRSDAVALVNQCFLKILLGLKNFDNTNGVKSYFSWIHKIMIHSAIDEIRKNKKQNDFHVSIENESHLEQLSKEEFNLIESTIEEETLQEMLNNLSEIQKNVFNLFAIDGFKHVEISEALSISIENSKWHLMQARKKLQSLLKEELEKQRINGHG